MKLNEFNGKQAEQLDELGVRDFIGDRGAAVMKQFGNRLKGNMTGKASVQDTMARRQFLDKVVGKLATALSSEIKNGTVSSDPNFKSGAAPAATPTAAAPTAPTAGKPAAPTAPTAGKPAAPTAPTAGKPAAPPAPTAGKPAAPTAPTAGKPAAPGANVMSNMASQLTRQPAPVNPAAQVAATARNRLANQPAPAGAPANNSAAGIAARKAALQQRQAAGPSGFQKAKAAATAKGVKNFESKYSQLNAVFESMINEALVQKSISDFVMNWLERFLGQQLAAHGPELKTNLKHYADQVQQTYGKDQGKAGLYSIATTVHDVVSNPVQPSGAPQAPAGGPTASTQAPAAAPAVAQPSSPATPSPSGSAQGLRAKDIIRMLSQMNPSQQQKVLDYLQQNLPTGTTP